MKSTRCLMMLFWLFVFVVGVRGQPLAQYTFNDGTSKDVTGNGYDGVLLDNAVIVADPERGQVLQVNQSGMQVDGPFEITTSFTLSAWAKLDVPRTGRYYFGGPWWIRTDNQGASEHHWCEIRYPGGDFVDKFDTRAPDNPDGQLDGQWHHIAVVLPEDGAVKAYVDGALAPVRDNNTKAHNFEGAVGPLFFGTENASGGNAISGYMDDIRVYNYALSEAEIPGLMIEGLGSEFAHQPNPIDEATDVPRDVILTWNPGEFADKHNVYLGTDFDDVNDAAADSTLLVGPGLTESSLDVGNLAFGQTYYWRVDEVSAPPDNTIFTGQVWSFTVEPYGYPIENITAVESSSDAPEQVPENTTNGSGLDDSGLLHGNYSAGTMWLSNLTGDQPSWIAFEFDQSYNLHEMWVWNYNESWEQSIGVGIKDATIEYSVDGSDYATLGITHEFNQGPGTADYAHNTTVDFEGVTAKYVKLTANSNWGEGILNQYGLSEVRFFYIPVKAREPIPDSGATDVDVDVNLGWRAGREASSHEVYIGSDMNSLNLVDSVTQNYYDTKPLDLQLGETYYWKINEINDMDVRQSWEGDIWNFKIADFIVIDDFEDYDIGNKEIWWFWKDGLGYAAVDGKPAYPGNGTGSAVGDETSPSYMEETIVHGGRKSMPMSFNNTVATHSETELTFDIPEDWTRAGIQTLVLHFYEDPGNTGGQLYLKVNGERVDYTEDPGAAKPPEWVSWKQWNIDLVDLASRGIDLANVRTLTIGIDGIGVTGMFYFDDILLYKSAPPALKVLTWFEAESGTITAPMLVYMGDPTASGGHYIGTEETLGDETGNPPVDGIATYEFTVPGGTYKVVMRIVATSGSDTFWVRIPTATTNTNNHASGWVLFGQPQHSDDWQWTEVTSRDDDSQMVEFTLPAGTHTLEVARREDGALLDAVAVVSLTD